MTEGSWDEKNENGERIADTHRSLSFSATSGAA
jgi:hypothetical protein